jgi:hypothetical protein
MRKVIPSLAVVLLAAATVLGALQGTEEFPHQAHEGLFPLCEGCHVGIVTGEEASLFPDLASCTECHDGTRLDQVDWQPPGPRASNLEFFHTVHEDVVELDGSSVTCQGCHAADGVVLPAPRMAVAAAAPESCLECHVHGAPAHLSPAAECAVCHVPLTEAERIPTERIALFPWPDSHDAPGFISEHAPGTPLEEISCGICHASNTCERCHVNADRLEPITRLASDPRVAELEEGKVAEYPVPESHLASGWSWDHGTSALAGPAQCSTCHTRPSCTECHIEGGPQSAGVIAALPDPVPGGAPGVDLSHAGERLHPFDFDERHATFAATGALQCAECHSQQYCSDCHAAAQASRDFHPDNFLERHALEVFAGGSNCQSCHSTEAFCRDCHEQTGIASEGRLNVAFHTAQPMWILTHGQAARIGLESCASCHQQTDCLACHSTFLGRGVNPHGPGFNAEGMAARNRVTCRWCHLDDPLGGG